LTKTFTVHANSDQEYDPGETIRLSLSAPSLGGTVGSKGNATITITDPQDRDPPEACDYTCRFVLNLPWQLIEIQGVDDPLAAIPDWAGGYSGDGSDLPLPTSVPDPQVPDLPVS